MARYIAFLRGINVGGHQVTMDDLRRSFEALDFDNVATFIASGNVIFDAGNPKPATLTRRIERQLRDSLGYEVPTFLRTDAELARIADHEPFPDLDAADGDSSYVAFLYKRPTAAAAKKVVAMSNETDHVAIHDRELYWRIRGRMVDSTLGAAVFEKELGSVPATVRNLNTVRRLAAKYPPARAGRT
ncbi:MAG TPA: DUF1697 domain-containing protein [Acidimicrobiales bacterium]|nr:DUF1697 domain-containing protein [Acidimicrobiales bacterium]